MAPGHGGNSGGDTMGRGIANLKSRCAFVRLRNVASLRREGGGGGRHNVRQDIRPFASSDDPVRGLEPKPQQQQSSSKAKHDRARCLQRVVAAADRWMARYLSIYLSPLRCAWVCAPSRWLSETEDLCTVFFFFFFSFFSFLFFSFSFSNFFKFLPFTFPFSLPLTPSPPRGALV